MLSIVVCLGACGLGIAACGGSSKSASTAQGVTTTPTSEVVRPPKPDFVVLVAGTTISGGGRKTVKLGQTVRIQVVADVTDEVHLHGYDKKVNVSKGLPGTLTFAADVPGIFPVELESRGLKLMDLVVK
jgi:hypothetical protein